MRGPKGQAGHMAAGAFATAKATRAASQLCQQERSQPGGAILPLALPQAGAHLEPRVLVGVLKKMLTKWNKPRARLLGGQGLQHMRYMKRLRCLSSPEKRRVREICTVVHSCLMGGCREDGIRLLSEVHGGRSRGSKHKVDMGNAIHTYIRAFSPRRWSTKGAGEVVAPPSLEISQTELNTPPNNLCYLHLPWAGVGDLQQVPSHQNCSAEKHFFF